MIVEKGRMLQNKTHSLAQENWEMEKKYFKQEEWELSGIFFGECQLQTQRAPTKPLSLPGMP